MQKNSEKFLEVCRSAMREQGVSVSELARRLGCSRPWLSNALAGKHDLKMSSCEAIAAQLGLQLVTVPMTATAAKRTRKQAS